MASVGLNRMKKTSSNKVVWVEDDRSQIIEAVNILRDHGLDVTVIEDPSRCIEYISSDPANCSVVIVDIVMPGVQMIHFVEEGEQQNIRTMDKKTLSKNIGSWSVGNKQPLSV
jgi:DNA-binding NtrC family response regulator